MWRRVVVVLPRQTTPSSLGPGALRRRLVVPIRAASSTPSGTPAEGRQNEEGKEPPQRDEGIDHDAAPPSFATQQYRLLDPTFATPLSDPVHRVLSLANAASKDRRKAAAQAAAWAFRLHDVDCGSSRVQIARLTVEIEALKKHFDLHKKDQHSRYGFQAKLNKREKLLKYLKRTNPHDYAATCHALGIVRKRDK